MRFVVVTFGGVVVVVVGEVGWLAWVGSGVVVVVEVVVGEGGGVGGGWVGANPQQAKHDRRVLLCHPPGASHLRLAQEAPHEACGGLLGGAYPPHGDRNHQRALPHGARDPHPEAFRRLPAHPPLGHRADRSPHPRVGAQSMTSERPGRRRQGVHLAGPRIGISDKGRGPGLALPLRAGPPGGDQGQGLLRHGPRPRGRHSPRSS